MTNPARITAQLDLMAHEAAQLYASLCLLEGDQPLLDPHNAAVMERMLQAQAENYRAIWDAARS